ncbi:endonuclease/exonuclease/phosphatase family protein [Gossypium australe]|uniref:Endonuclease/exonuclease/phosphatase family protein n=1 Tax=Gossypium australe TaxID=47621 RepID=A0A5B6X1G0_9ROSI|nr:endonuclease/exonuclease/phosphatase family protein [Gossypium australe]
MMGMRTPYSKDIGDSQRASRPDAMKILCWNARGLGNSIEVLIEGTHKGLSIRWNEGCSIMLRNLSRNHIDVEVQEVPAKPKWRMTGFYGVSDSHHRIESWNLLRSLGQDQNFPWMLEDMGYSSPQFTWEKGNFPENNIRERLDREVVNAE